MNIKLIVTDNDGCLAPGKGRPIETEWLKKIAEYNASAVSNKLPALTVCTGRSQPYVECMLQVLNGIFPGICEHGSFLYDPVKDVEITNPLLNKETFTQINKLKMGFLSNLEKWDAKLETCKEVCVTINPLSDMPCEELFHKVEEYVPKERFNVIYDTFAVNVSPKEISKGNGLKLLSDYCGIPMEEMAGIGDSAADLAFMELTAFKACPANADIRVKEIADYISPYSYTRGIWDIICHINKTLER